MRRGYFLHIMEKGLKMRILSISNSSAQGVNKQQNPKAANFSRVSSTNMADSVSFKGKTNIAETLIEKAKNAEKLHIRMNGYDDIILAMDKESFHIREKLRLNGSNFLIARRDKKPTFGVFKLDGSFFQRGETMTIEQFNKFSSDLMGVVASKVLDKHEYKSNTLEGFFMEIADAVKSGEASVSSESKTDVLEPQIYAQRHVMMPGDKNVFFDFFPKTNEHKITFLSFLHGREFYDRICVGAGNEKKLAEDVGRLLDFKSAQQALKEKGEKIAKNIEKLGVEIESYNNSLPEESKKIEKTIEDLYKEIKGKEKE